jgi:multidrug efflux pump subunit AcrB
MSLLEFPIRRYQFTLVAFLCLVALGVYSFLSLPREEDPSFNVPGFTIAVIMPGADPKQLEQLVAKPIEDRIAELDDVMTIDTTVTNGVSFIALEFEAWADPAKKYDEVTRELNALRPSLPAEIQLIDVRKFNPGFVNIAQYALSSPDATYRELEDQARLLKEALKHVDGVRTAESWAYPQRELRVELDLPRMAELKLSVTQVGRALQSDNTNMPAGSLDLGARNFSLQTSGAYENLDQVRDTVVTSIAGRTLRVRDIATVRWDEQTWTHVGRYNGVRAAFVTANMKSGYNMMDVQRAMDRAVTGFRAALPHRIELQQGFVQSDNVRHRLNRLYLDFSIAIALVLLTLLPLGLRAAGIVMISIPLSLAVGLSALYFLGFSLNQLSIAGFVVALGLLVDDSIVAVENIARHMRGGMKRTDAALAGTRQIAVAILGCTATLIFAFLPLLALPGTPGKFIRVMPLAVVATVIGSLLIALLVIPFIASRVLDEHTPAHGNALLDQLMGAIHRYYRPALHFCLGRPRRTVAISIGGALLLSVLLAMFMGSSLFPKADTPQFLVQVTTPNGSSLAETDRAVHFAESTVRGLPDFKAVFANVGHGNPQVYYNHIVRNDAANYGELFVTLNSYNAHSTPRALDLLRTELDRYPGARIYVHEFTNGIPISAPIAVRVIGQDLDRLDTLSREVEAVVKGTPGTRDISNPLRVRRTNLRFDFNAQKAAMLGVPSVEFDRAARLAVSGLQAGTFKDPSGEQYAIVMRAPLRGRADLSALDNVRVPTLTGQSLPLAQLASLHFDAAPVVIARYNRERAVTINSEVQRGYNTNKVTSEVVKRLNAMAWPRGYHYRLGGDAEASSKSFAGIGTAAIVAVFGIFAILVLEFGNFRSTLIVLTVVPLGVFGGLLMLLLTRNDISFVASIGFIALVGIEIKNSILFVDFTNQLRTQGMSVDAAIEQAGEIRFLPILLTTVTAIGGLLPLAVQNIGMYSPMAWVIIGGLISSTLLARLVTPVVYKLIPPDP